MAIRRAVKECIKKGVLKDVLVKHRAEVESVFLTTIDKKLYEEALRLDAIEDGKEEGMRIGLEEGRTKGRAEGEKAKLKELVEKKLRKGCSLQEIADVLEEELEVIEKIIKEL